MRFSLVPRQLTQSPDGYTHAILDDLNTAVTNATSVETSATALIDGFAARVQAAVDKAVGNGATEAQLAPVQAEVDALNKSVANTPAA